MKNLITIISAIFVLGSLSAQDCLSYSLLKEGTKWVMTQYNKKDKVEGSIEYEVLKESSDGGEKVWEMKMINKDKKGEILTEAEYSMSCENNVFKVNADAFLPAETSQSMEGMEMEIDATNTEFPNDMKVGDKLPDSRVDIKAGMNGMNIMNMTVVTKNRNVLAEEKIETEAGSYNTLKIEETSEVKNSLMSRETKSITYFVPGFWMVKQEYFDKKGNPDGYSLMNVYEQK